jgi:nucleotide-binding universal stress UspA family protein
VPLDGSEIANQALPYALQLASQSGAELVLFRVVPDLEAEVSLINNMPVLAKRQKRSLTMLWRITLT